MTEKSFKNFSCFDVPDYNLFIVTSWKESIFMNLKGVHPSSMSLIHFRLSSFNIKGSNNRITSSHKNKLFCNFHTLYGFFGTNKALYYFIIFQIHCPNHFIPWTSKQHIVLHWYLSTNNWVSKFKNLSTNLLLKVPKSYGAIISGCYQCIFSFSQHTIYSVGVS